MFINILLSIGGNLVICLECIIKYFFFNKNFVLEVRWNSCIKL